MAHYMKNTNTPAYPALSGRRRGLEAKKNLTGYMFVAPAVLFFAVFVIIPLCLSLYIGFLETNIFFRNVKFAGLNNFARLFSDPIFGKSLVNILMYALMAVPMNVVFSLGLALLLNMRRKGTKVFRTLFYIPSVTSAVAASLIWLWMLNVNNGLFNEVLKAIGLPAYSWLSHSSTALFSVTIVTVWMGLGGNMIIFLAALQGLPAEIYEAADIDGASSMRKFFSLTIPFLSPTMFFILTMTLIGAFQLYDQVFVLTGGGPANSTMTPVYLIWQNAFGSGAVRQAGYAAAQSLALFVVIMTVSFLVRGLNKMIDF